MSTREDLGAVVATLEAATSIGDESVTHPVPWGEIASRLDLAIEELRALRDGESDEEWDEHEEALRWHMRRQSAWQGAEYDALFPAPGGGA